MNFNPNKTPVEVIKEGIFGELILETFTLVLMVNDRKSRGNNLMG